jgi:nucleotide-binding universal stress UspA family protein
MQNQRDQLMDSLDAVESRLRRRGGVVYTALLQGEPAAALNEYLNQTRPDLLVMGAQGLRAVPLIRLGGVAQQMVEYTQQPVWIMRQPYRGLKRMLMITDGSPASRRAILFLARLPLPADAAVIGMHVTAPAEVDENGESAPVLTGRSALDEVSTLLAHTGQLVDCIEAVGDATAEILAAVERLQIDVIVAGGRGQSPVSTWLVGSVIRKLAHYAPCSVLIVR